MDPGWSEFSSSSTKGHTRAGFCGGAAPDMGACLDTRKEHQATRELWEVSLHEEVPFLGCLCLTPFA